MPITRYEIKKFILESWHETIYTLPYQLFSYQYLNHLKLKNCIFVPPPTFKGFPHLHTLDLLLVTISDDALESLVSNSPLLENLILQFFDFPSLRINAPNLRDFQFYGIFEDIVLKNTVLLSTVGIYLESLIKDDKSGRLTDFICSLPRIKELTMDTNLLKYLVRDNVPGDLPVQSTRLKFLSMLINFLSPKEILAALCMLRCAPNLHKLEIVVCNSAQASESVEEPKIDIFQGLDYLSSTFSHLEHVKINQVAGLKLELKFIEVLLASAAGLKDVTIELGIGYERSEIYKELLQFRRASPQAKIIYLDH